MFFNLIPVEDQTQYVTCASGKPDACKIGLGRATSGTIAALPTTSFDWTCVDDALSGGKDVNVQKYHPVGTLDNPPTMLAALQGIDAISKFDGLETFATPTVSIAGADAATNA